MDSYLWWVGAIFCSVSGACVALLVLGLLIEKVADKFTNIRALFRIINFAHKHRLDLKTGLEHETEKGG